MRLDYSFFYREDTLEVARDLIGKVLVSETRDGVVKGIINETEAYREDDESSHGFDGRETKRNSVMFGRAGKLYVYFTYGMHYCANIVTGKEGRAEAVLIRSVIPIDGVELMRVNRKKDGLKNLTNGPAKVCQAFDIGKEENGFDLTRKDSLIYLEDLGHMPQRIKKTTRVGISKAKDLEWRFVCDDFKF